MDSDDSLDSDDSWESEGTSDSEEEIVPILPIKKLLEPEEIISLATSDTKVLILDGSRPSLWNLMKLDYVDILECWEYDNEEDCPPEPEYTGPIEGPDCHICGKVIIPDDYRISINKEIYTVIWKEDVKKEENIKEVGILQCVFCLNFFHRHKCSLFLSHKSYLNKKISKSWSCAKCTPVFISKLNPVQKCSKNELLVSVFKLMCKLADKTVRNFIVDLYDNRDVLKHIIQISNEFNDFDNG